MGLDLCRHLRMTLLYSRTNTSSETGIPGASFAALGAVDPFSLLDQASYVKVFGEDLSTFAGEYQAEFDKLQSERLGSLGYSEKEILNILDEKYGADPRQRFIKAEYNGLVTNTKHNNVRFEVVLNTFDKLARPLSSLDGSACSHIAKSCDIRWLWFQPVLIALGHSMELYSYYTPSKFTQGWQNMAQAKGNESLINLPGVTKNMACGYCSSDAFCESNKCSMGIGACLGAGGLMPTFCPASDDEIKTRGPCSDSNMCQSGRCESLSTLQSSYYCYDKLETGESCNENSDCISNYCSWWFKCG